MTTGTATERRSALVALVGNPNAGKTSVFNALTGGSQRVGNYPGVTVERVSGTYKDSGAEFEVLDVPGLYSLQAVSADESVAVGTLLETGESRPDALVVVVDASSLERNLFLYSQVSELGLPLVVALTMTDVLDREGQVVNLARLAAELGAEVIPVVAHKMQGVGALKSAIARACNGAVAPQVEIGYPAAVDEPVARLRERLSRHGIDASASQVRQALLTGGAESERLFSAAAELQQALVAERETLLGAAGQGKTLDTQARYAWAAKVARESVTRGPNARPSRSDRIDAILTHRVFGLVVFFAVMYAVFQSIYTLAGPLMDLIEAGTGWLGDLAGGWLDGAPMIRDLVVDGVITGIGSVVIFLPQILILFLFIAVLEGSGYLARAAFLMDRALGWCGLNGRAFIPLLSSFACAVPGIMAARVMPDPRSRLATILVAPLMSCSARLPVYVLMIGAFIEPSYGPMWAGIALFGMHFLGLLVAIPVVLILNRGVLKGRRLPFMLELPRYQWPKWRDVLLTMRSRAVVFLKTAGTIIFALSIVIWALLYFPRGESADAGYRSEYRTLPAERAAAISEEHFIEGQRTRDSYLGRFGRAVEPVFEPAGFDWRLSTAILAAFPAREVVVSAMGIIFQLGGDVDEENPDLRTTLQNATWPDGRRLVTPWSAVSLMVFFALCCQCMATLATIKRETNSWKWATFAFVYMTVLAYILSVAVNQIGERVS